MSSRESSSDASPSAEVSPGPRPMGRGWSRLFVIGLFLAIVGLAAAQSYYLLSIAESSEVAADTTEAVGAPADTTAAP